VYTRQLELLGCLGNEEIYVQVLFTLVHMESIFFMGINLNNMLLLIQYVYHTMHCALMQCKGMVRSISTVWDWVLSAHTRKPS
jgi:hypothetical protein